MLTKAQAKKPRLSKKYYIKPIKWKTIPIANSPRIIIIGDTFFLSNHIQSNVIIILQVQESMNPSYFVML